MTNVLHVFSICISVSDWTSVCVLRMGKVRTLLVDGENERCIALILIV